ncbi:response regulator [Metabacillus sp. FJAT-53654]|uniref:Response regulator n=1 Tax=Metabacillus rhizosphaerae TaxID=3117747 RepID=A0ABZ2MT35_9BACI
MFKLMIVDDEPIILQGIKDMVLESKTAFTKIVVANDGFEALDKMEYFQPDLIITDIQMPEMTGLEFIRQARRKQVKRFIILTGFDVFEYARQAIQLKVVDYLLKPINEQDLFRLLKKISVELTDEKKLDQNNSQEQNGQPNDNIKILVKYMKSNYMNDISLSDAGEYLNMHPVYIGQIFKKATGCTFVHFLNQLRVEKAKEMLKEMKDLSLEKIAKCVGYDNPRTFYKVFRKYTGKTPGQFREE